MKPTILGPITLAIFGLGYAAPGLEQAPLATDSAPPTTTTTEPAKATSPAHLSSATADVLKLVKAKVDEPTIVAFINNSGRVYNLTATQIIDLKSQGVSDSVLTAMLQQTTRAIKTAEAPPPPAYAVAPQPISTNYQPGMAYGQNQMAGSTQPVYIYPDSTDNADYSPYYSGYYPYYSYYPYSYGYYPYWWGYYPYYCGGYYYHGHYYCYPYHGYHGGYYHGGYYGHGGYHGGYGGHGVPYSGGARGAYAGYHGGAPAGSVHGGGSFAVSHGGGGHVGGGGHGGGGHR